MCPDSKSENARRGNSVAVDWRECAWSPLIVVQTRATKPLPAPPLFLHTPRRNLIFSETMKTISLHPRRTRAAFTLIELLVVISIIAILAALLLPVISRVQQAARKNKAKLEAQSIATAIEGYDSAYGRFPVSGNVQNQASLNAQANLNPDFTYGGTFQKPDGTPYIVQSPGLFLTNSEVIAILMDFTNYPNSSGSTINTNHQKNPQQTKFLNATMVGDTSSPGVGTDLVYRDPWGNPYVITMDLNYDEQCKDAFYCLDKVSGFNQTSANPGLNGLTTDGTANNFEYHGKVMVWSAGPLQVNNKAVVDQNSPANTGFNKNHVLSWQ
jgi:prepilin-type N-terminal cleavage/methylation domain-containing protein